MKYNPKSYRYLGYTYPDVPKSWEPIVIQLIKDIDKIARPKWLPRIVANWLYWLAMGNSIIRIRNKYWYNIWTKIPIKCHIHQIKDKYTSLRVYVSGTNEVYELINKAENDAENTCEDCGSNNDVQIVDGNWVFAYCKDCRIKHKDILW